MVKSLQRLCVLLPLLLIEIEIWPFKIEFWAVFFRFLHLWFLQGLPLSVLVVIGSLTFSDWCQRLPGWPGPQPSTLLWRGHCLSKHEAFSSSISTSFKIHCTFLLNFALKFWMGSLFCLKGAKEKVLSRKKALHFQRTFGHHFLSTLPMFLQIFFKYLQCLHLSLLHCKDKLSCPVNTPGRNCAITHL